MNPVDPTSDPARLKEKANRPVLPESDKIPGRKTFKRTASRRIVHRLAMISLIAVIGLFILSMTASRPTNLGVNGGRLAKCPPSPNCVSTQAERTEQRMPAISFECDPDEMLARIKDTVKSEFPRATLVSEFDHYLHFEFTSRIFRFVDDVEFYVDDKTSEVHFRSASRVGHSDMGTNRKRMKQISESLNP